jgi:hypothetical protein
VSSQQTLKRRRKSNTMPRNPFKPLSPRKSIVSDHPKTVFGRKELQSKSGIALARHRDQSAFRTSKSRKLKALHVSNKWKTLSESQRHEAEAEIVTALEQQLAEKEEAHKLEWRHLVESGVISDDDDDDAMVLDSGAEVAEGEEGEEGEQSDDGEVERWVTRLRGRGNR